MNKVLVTTGAVCWGLAGALLVGAFQSHPATAAKRGHPDVSRIEQIVHYSEISQSGVYVLCYDGSEFLISSFNNVTVTQVRRNDWNLPKEC